MTSVTEQPTLWWAPALRETERPSASIPDWVLLTERAFDCADQQPSRPVPAAEPGLARCAAEAHFAPVITPLLETALAPLRRSLADAADVAPAALNEVAQELCAGLSRTVARTMVAELHRHLAGQGTAADFEAVIADASSETGLRALAVRYPVLFRLLATQADARARAVLELLRRLRADRAELASQLLDGRDPGPLVSIRTGGDTHRLGRSVCLLGFADGTRLVYKPRPMAVHHAMRRVLDTIEKNTCETGCPLDFRRVAVLDRTDSDGAAYGWMQHVESQDCRNAGEVAAFFRRQGALLAVLHVLRGTDMHCENVVAAGDQPVLLDLETLLHPDLVDGHRAASPDPATQAVDRSVMRTAMLPRHGGQDLSGFGGRPGSTPASVHYLDAGLPSMRLVRRPGQYPGGDNRPRLAGVEASAAEHIVEVIDGFRTAYDALRRQAGQLLVAGGAVEQLCAEPSRVVLRNTKVYARLLDETTHPQVLADASARERVLRLLAEHGGHADERLAASEVEQLWHGDVPVFELRPGHPGVFAADGVAPVLPESVEHGGNARELLGRLSVSDRERQVWILRAALLGTASSAGQQLATAGVTPPRRLDVPRPGGTKDLLTEALVIGDRLIAEALDDGRRCNWLTLYQHPDGSRSILPMGMDLANGYLGTALFLAQLARVGGAARHRDCARRALVDVPDQLELLVAERSSPSVVGAGAFHGLGGVAFALHQLTRLLDDSGLDAATATAVELLSRTEDAADLSVASGRAGGLLSLLALGEAGCSRAAVLAEPWADRLATDATDRELPGFPTSRSGLFQGQLGVAWALARAGRRLGRADLARRAEELLRRLSGDRGALGADVACGIGGLALAYHEVDPVSFTTRRLHKRLAGLAAGSADDSLAVGGLGLADIALHTSHDQLDRTTERICRLGLASTVSGQTPRCATPGSLAIPGLLYGLAGIGYGLLRLHDPVHIPSVLALQTTGG